MSSTQDQPPPPPYTPTVTASLPQDDIPPPPAPLSLTPRHKFLNELADKIEALSGSLRASSTELRATTATEAVNEASVEEILDDTCTTIEASLRAVTTASSPSNRRSVSRSNTASVSTGQPRSRDRQTWHGPPVSSSVSNQPRSAPVVPVSAGIRHGFTASTQTTLYIDSVHASSGSSHNYTHRVYTATPNGSDPLFTAVAAGKTYDDAPFLSLSRATLDNQLLQVITLEPSIARVRKRTLDGPLPTEVWLRTRSAARGWLEIEVRFKNAFNPPLRVFRSEAVNYLFSSRKRENGALSGGFLKAGDGSLAMEIVGALGLEGRAEVVVAPRFDLLLATDVALAALHLAAETHKVLAPAARGDRAQGGTALRDNPPEWLQAMVPRMLGPSSVRDGPPISNRRSSFLPDHLR